MNKNVRISDDFRNRVDKDVFSKRFEDLVREENSEKTIIEIANDIGVHQSMLYNYMSQRNFPSNNTLEKICEYFDVSPRYFYEDYNEDGYTSRDIAEELGKKVKYASHLLSKYKNEYPDRVKEGYVDYTKRKVNILDKKYWEDFRNFIPGQHKKEGSVLEIEENILDREVVKKYVNKELQPLKERIKELEENNKSFWKRIVSFFSL